MCWRRCQLLQRRTDADATLRSVADADMSQWICKLHLGIREECQYSCHCGISSHSITLLLLWRKTTVMCVLSVPDLEKTELARASTALLGGRTDTVTVLLIRENGTVVWWVLNFDRSTIKHAFQSNWSDCQHGFLTALECTKFVLAHGCAPMHAGGLYSDPPDHMV